MSLPNYLLKIKLAQFNIDSDNVLIFNTTNQTLIEFNLDELKQLQDYFKSHNSENYNNFIDKLTEHGLLKNEYKKNFDTNIINSRLVIIPTLRCNKNCSYCYHAGNINLSMAPNDTDLLIKYLKKYFNKIGLSGKLSIIWHGGEPLLNFGIIKDISKKLQSYIIENNVEYEESLLTNGLLLDDFMIEEIIIDTKINEIQISFDSKYTKKQVNKMYKNIEKFFNYNKDINIFIKYNLTEIDFTMVNKHIDFFSPLHQLGNVNFRLGYLDSHGDIDTNRYMIYSDFVKKHWALADYLRKKGLGWEPELPKEIYSVCVANDSNSLTIGPDLNIYRCNVNAPRDKWKIYDIKNKRYSDIFNDAEGLFMNYNVFKDKRCVSCPVIYNCLGGCHVKRIFNQRTKEYCNATRLRIQLQIIDYYKYFHL